MLFQNISMLQYKKHKNGNTDHKKRGICPRINISSAKMVNTLRTIFVIIAGRHEKLKLQHPFSPLRINKIPFPSRVRYARNARLSSFF